MVCLNEVDHVPLRAAAEAMEDTQFVIQMEGWGAILVEGAAAPKVAASPFEGCYPSNYEGNGRRRLDCLAVGQNSASDL